MTEERIRDIIVENDVHLTDVIIKAMKQAVNEALDEAAEKGETTFETKHYFGDKSCPTYNELSVYKPSILNLKVK